MEGHQNEARLLKQPGLDCFRRERRACTAREPSQVAANVEALLWISGECPLRETGR
jgi:hypothetical protein